MKPGLALVPDQVAVVEASLVAITLTMKKNVLGFIAPDQAEDKLGSCTRVSQQEKIVFDTNIQYPFVCCTLQ